MARCDIARVIAKAQELTAPLIAERGHHLSVCITDGPLAVIGDDARLAEMVANLLIDAAKYTEPGGTIAINAGIENDSIVIRVVRSIVALHDGEVIVDSDGPGKTSELTIRLPRAPAELAAPLPLPAPAVTSATRDPASRLRVLVVDDNPDVTEVMQDALGALGCEPQVAHNGASALEAAATFLPDVAIVDIGMPGMDGYELARRLRTMFDVRPSRIVALTGYGEEADRTRAREAGFDDHIVKPVLLTTLRELIQSCRTALSGRQD
jgi:CheY-like chemotaxis protein